MNITAQNIETYLLLYIDGELSLKEQQCVLAYIKEHPEWERILEEYTNMRIPVPDIIPFDYQSLLKEDTDYTLETLPLTPNKQQRILIFQPYIKYIAAAIIVIISSATIIKLLQQPEEIITPSPTIAHHTTAQQKSSISQQNKKTESALTLTPTIAKATHAKAIVAKKTIAALSQPEQKLTTVEDKKETLAALAPLTNNKMIPSKVVANISTPCALYLESEPEETPSTTVYKRTNLIAMVTHKIPENMVAFRDKVIIATTNLKSTKIKLEW
jgi:cytoskeletal protein RodZ